jgi:hypothetical protein
MDCVQVNLGHLGHTWLKLYLLVYLVSHRKSHGIFSKLVRLVSRMLSHRIYGWLICLALNSLTQCNTSRLRRILNFFEINV